jgi:phage shock protein E
MTYKFLLSITSVLMFAALQGCAQSQKENKDKTISIISPTEFKEQFAEQLILDVRSTEEFAEAHIEGAINNNVFDENFTSNVKGFDKNKPIFVYCKSGKRSNMAAVKLSNLGFKKIYDLEGGILNWIKNDYKVVN